MSRILSGSAATLALLAFVSPVMAQGVGAGYWNEGTVNQVGDDNLARIIQEGNYNQAGTHFGTIYGDTVAFTISTLAYDHYNWAINELQNTLYVDLIPSSRHFDVYHHGWDWDEFGITQLGDYNDAVIEQLGDWNKAAGFQYGDNNNIEIEQHGDYNTAFAKQIGDDNHSRVFQDGNYNEAYTTQYGDYNYSLVSQMGDQNEAQVLQWGDYNISVIGQDGYQNVASHAQVGGWNYALTSQSGNMNTSVISQTGSSGH